MSTQRVSSNDSKKDTITYTDPKSTLAINKQKLARHMSKTLNKISPWVMKIEI